ncbi:MAG: hypothetical protein PHX25_02890 [Candidatus Pacebacteria bacterium]|nr:hypothetical protein [Candidatus Paceibacterota bacterium]
MDREKKTGKKLVQTLREAGFQCDEAIVVKPTEKDLRRMKETIAFVRKVDEVREATKNSILHLG